MRLIKTEVKGYYYTQNKNGITYYYNYRDKVKKHSVRKKIMTAKEHNSINLTEALKQTDIILNEKKTEQVLNETNFNLDENLNLNDFTLNQIIDIRHEKYYQESKRKLKEHYAGYSDEYFENDTVVKKKLYSIQKRILQYNKHVRKSSIGKMKYKNIKRKHVINYLESEISQKLALKTKYNIIVYIKAAINEMIRNDYITLENVFKKNIKIKNDRRQRTRVLTPDELELLLKECKKYNKPRKQIVKRGDTGTSYNRVLPANYSIYTSVYLAVITASRSSSVLTIMKKDINLVEKTITLINHKASNNKYKVPINDEAVKWFEKILVHYDENDYLVRPNTDYTRGMVGVGNSMRFIPREVFKIMDKLFNKHLNKQINLERDHVVNFHTIRRSVATQLALGGVSIYSIKSLLDHKSVDVTERYLNLSYEDYKQDLEIFQNRLFKGFKKLIVNSEANIQEKPKNIEKDDLIEQILIKSGNEGNEIVRQSLGILNDDELKQKLISYI